MRGEADRTVLLVLHHLVVDGVSWRILRDDLARACAQVSRGAAVDLGAKTSSYRQWANALARHAATAGLAGEVDYWLAQAGDDVPLLPSAGGDATAAAADTTVSSGLSAADTRALLHDVPAAYRTQINDVLLCALAGAIGSWTGRPRIRVALEGHGRDEAIAGGLDLTRTVGWFTSLYPLVIDVTGADGPGERLQRVKEQLRAVPQRGIGYGVLRHLSPDPSVREALASQAEPEIVFNYLGQFDVGDADGGFAVSAGPRGPASAAANRPSHPLTVNCGIDGTRLRLHWTFDASVYPRATVERVAQAHAAALRRLVAHCRTAGAGGYTPSDFPLAGVDQAQLDAALAGRRGVEDLYPLSPLQEGLLFHAVAADDTQPYQVQIVQRLDGPLHVPSFQRAWAQVVEEHPILRTAFLWRGLDRPLQRVDATADVPWLVEDWRHYSPAEQRAALERHIASDRQRGFVLESAPLLRCALFRIGEEAYWFARNQHHLLIDGWSMARLTRDAFGCYRALCLAEARPQPQPPPRPYRDYIHWLQRQDGAAAEAYWRRVLAGVTVPTPLGLDRGAAGGPDARDHPGRGARGGCRGGLRPPVRPPAPRGGVRRPFDRRHLVPARGRRPRRLGECGVLRGEGGGARHPAAEGGGHLRRLRPGAPDDPRLSEFGANSSTRPRGTTDQPAR